MSLKPHISLALESVDAGCNSCDRAPKRGKRMYVLRVKHYETRLCAECVAELTAQVMNV